MRRITNNEILQLVNMLLECATIQNDHIRNDILAFLKDTIRNSIPRRDTVRADVISIVTTCNAYPGALTALIEGVRAFEQGSFAMQQIDSFLSNLKDSTLTQPSTPTQPRTAAQDFISVLRQRLVQDREANDVSSDSPHADFAFVGYRDTLALMELVALVIADGFTHEAIVARREAFFSITRTLPRRYGLRPGMRNPNGLLCFVFEHGCPEQLVAFIQKQTQIEHFASDGGLMVSWVLDLHAQQIHVHNNPLSWLPPVYVIHETVFPGLKWLTQALKQWADER